MFEVRAGETTEVEPITLATTAGELAGIVLIEGSTDHSGTVIAVQGTSHSAATDPDGNWSIEGVAAGQYRIEAWRSFQQHQIIP